MQKWTYSQQLRSLVFLSRQTRGALRGAGEHEIIIMIESSVALCCMAEPHWRSLVQQCTIKARCRGAAKVLSVSNNLYNQICLQSQVIVEKICGLLFVSPHWDTAQADFTVASRLHLCFVCLSRNRQQKGQASRLSYWWKASIKSVKKQRPTLLATTCISHLLRVCCSDFHAGPNVQSISTLQKLLVKAIHPKVEGPAGLQRQHSMPNWDIMPAANSGVWRGLRIVKVTEHDNGAWGEYVAYLHSFAICCLKHHNILSTCYGYLFQSLKAKLNVLEFIHDWEKEGSTKTPIFSGSTWRSLARGCFPDISSSDTGRLHLSRWHIPFNTWHLFMDLRLTSLQPMQYLTPSCTIARYEYAMRLSVSILSRTT